MTVRLVLGWALLLVATPSIAQTAESIRVLLYQDARRVELSAESELRVVTDGRELRGGTSRLVLTPSAATVEMNGRSVPAARVLVRAAESAVRAVGQNGAAVEDRAPPLAPPALFPRLAASSPTATEPSSRPSPGSQTDGFLVSGEIEVLARDGGLWVINRLDLEDYVLGVVPAEMSAAWHPQALRVQAVATRTYALHQMMMRNGRDYDVVATIRDQVYRGGVQVAESVRRAVEETRGLVLTYEDRPILAAFSSTAAGPTEDAATVWAQDLPYLQGVECPFDRKSPYYEWTTAFPLAALEARLRQEGWDVGAIATLTPSGYSRAGRVSRLRILHSRGETTLRGEDLRRIVGYRVVPSTRFTIDAIGREVVMSGYGAGHAVGLCQWGAKELAELGYPYDAILRYYFPGTELTPSYRLHRPTDPVR